jgi:hypothetical protein
MEEEIRKGGEKGGRKKRGSRGKKDNCKWKKRWEGKSMQEERKEK